jgi:acyl-CoA-binding protein
MTGSLEVSAPPASLQESFAAAVAHSRGVAEKTLPENTLREWAAIFLQATKGDWDLCDNAGLESELTEAWAQLKGKPMAWAKGEYIRRVAASDPEWGEKVLHFRAIPSTADVIKTKLSAILYKKRDHLPGWRARRFILEGSTLKYELLEGDQQEPQSKQQQQQQPQPPRGELELGGRCMVTGPALNPNARTADGIPLYVFKAHIVSEEGQRRESTWSLGSTDKIIAERWVLAVKLAAEESQGIRCLSPVPESNDCQEDGNPQEITPTHSPIRDCGKDIMPQEEIAAIQAKLSEATNEVLVEASSTEKWMPWFEARGVSSMRKRCVKRGYSFYMGTGVIDHSPEAVLAVIRSNEAAIRWDHSLMVAERLATIDSDTSVDCYTWRRAWPRGACCHVVATRATLSDLGNIIVTMVDAPEKICRFCSAQKHPSSSVVEQDGQGRVDRPSARATLDLGGWILRPMLNGLSTHATYLIRGTELRLPFRAALNATRRSPLAIAAVRELLDASRDAPTLLTNLEGEEGPRTGVSRERRTDTTAPLWSGARLPQQRDALFIGALFMAAAAFLRGETLHIDAGVAAVVLLAILGLLHQVWERRWSVRSDWQCFMFTFQVPVRPLRKFIHQVEPSSARDCTVVHLVLKAAADAASQLSETEFPYSGPLVAYTGASPNEIPIEIHGSVILDLAGYVRALSRAPNTPRNAQHSVIGRWLGLEPITRARVLVVGCGEMAEETCIAIPRGGSSAPPVSLTIGGVGRSPSSEGRKPQAVLQLSAVVQPYVGISAGQNFVSHVRRLLRNPNLLLAGASECTGDDEVASFPSSEEVGAKAEL